jgi:predicted Zn-dependent peptidase
VIEEIRGRLDDPAERVYRRAWHCMYRTAIGHPVAGTIASVARIQPADVARFLSRRLVHANTVLAVVGGVGAARAAAAVRRHFRGQGAEAPPPVPRVRRGSGGDVRVRDADSSQAYLALLLPVQPAPRRLLATGVAVDIVGADPDSRLFQELRERLGLSYEVSAHLEWGPDWACAVIAASGARSRAARLVRAVEETCRRAAEDGFDADELDRARKKLRYRYATLSDSRLDQAVALAESALWGFPTPQETERIVARLGQREVEAAWRAAVLARGGVRATLG